MTRYFRSPPRVPSTAEVDACLTRLDTEATARNHLLIAMAAMTGLRVSELAALDWSQVVTEAGNVRSRIELVPEHTKGNTGGSIVVPEALRWKLTRFRAWCSRRGLRVDGETPVFVSRNRRRISARRIQQVWRAVQVGSGIERPFRFHALRHFFGTHLYRTTHNIRLVQTAMRHHSISSTMIYTHISRAEVAAGIERAF